MESRNLYQLPSYEQSADEPVDSPLELAQDLMLLAVLPNHIRVLEKIADCLDHDNWQQAIEIGLFSTLSTMGTHLDATNSPDHPGLLTVKGAHRETMEVLSMATRLIEHSMENTPQSHSEHRNDDWDLVLPGGITEEERTRAIRVLKETIEGLIHGLHELGEAGQPDQSPSSV